MVLDTVAAANNFGGIEFLYILKNLNGISRKHIEFRFQSYQLGV